MRAFKHILITGAAGAIGGALAEQLAAKHRGARLTLVDLDTPALAARATKLKAVPAAWDLTESHALETRWREAVAAGGAVDLLVNCAGVMEIKSLAGTPWRQGEAMLRINFLSPMHLMHMAAEGMLAGGGGVIVNVSSMAGAVPIRGCSFYGGAKAGLAMASEIARLDLAKRGVDVITVYPGPINSQLESHARGQVAKGFISRNIPTGEPAAIAARIVAAIAERRARVVYPDVYRAAYQFLGLSGRFTSAFSPQPNE